MVRIVCLQRPQTEPAPQAFATCLVERPPASMACWTVVAVTPRQRQMYISGHGQLDGLDQAAAEQRLGGPPPRPPPSRDPTAAGGGSQPPPSLRPPFSPPP